MTVSILTILATLPSGAPGSTLGLEELGPYLAKHYDDAISRDRETRHALRDELYRDGGVKYMESWIDLNFTDVDTRDMRRRWVRHSRLSNPVKRIVRQESTIYQEPAERTVAGPTADTFRAVYDHIAADQTLLEASRLLNLHRWIALGFRVRELPDGTREPFLDVATPANARPVFHPNDAKLIVGWLIRTSCKPAVMTADVPVWTLWTAHESVQFREGFSVIAGSYLRNPVGVCPWFGVTLTSAAVGFFAGSEGEDLIDAAIMTWFSHVLLAKEVKSATKVAVMTGDDTTAARGQALDTEIPAHLPEGNSVTVHDLAMDLSQFQGVADHSLTHAGLNHEIPPSILTHQGTQSAEARDLLRLPIKEIRKQQQVVWRKAEQVLATVIAAILKVELPALWFDASQFRVRHLESETPLDPVKEHDLFLKRRAAGVDNTIDFLKRLHPGLTDAEAWVLVLRNHAIELTRNIVMRPLQEISGSLGASSPAPAPEPEPGPNAGPERRPLAGPAEK